MFDSWVWKMPWRRAMQPTPVFLPGEPHGERSLVGYSPWGRKEWDTTEQLNTRMDTPPSCEQYEIHCNDVYRPDLSADLLCS